ncbi:MAG: hypothetical protein WB579_22320 [Bryobacteraceae bacterium]
MKSIGCGGFAHTSANDSGWRDGDWNPQTAIAAIIKTDDRVMRGVQRILTHCTDRPDRPKRLAPD